MYSEINMIYDEGTVVDHLLTFLGLAGKANESILSRQGFALRNWMACNFLVSKKGVIGWFYIGYNIEEMLRLSFVKYILDYLD